MWSPSTSSSSKCVPLDVWVTSSFYTPPRAVPGRSTQGNIHNRHWDGGWTFPAKVHLAVIPSKVGRPLGSVDTQVLATASSQGTCKWALILSMMCFHLEMSVWHAMWALLVTVLQGFMTFYAFSYVLHTLLGIFAHGNLHDMVHQN